VYTVKQLSNLAGITIRTLHHYDQIGLLKPTMVGDNGYRYYGDEALYRLQQILFYRYLDMPLDEIKRILGRRDFDVMSALAEHRSSLEAEMRRMRLLVRTIDETINHLKGDSKMNPKKLFEGFSEAEQEKYAEEAATQWDAKTVQASNRRWKSYSADQKRRILDEGNALYADLIAVKAKGPTSREVQAVIARWHAHQKHFWSPSDDQLLGLADLYTDDPRFRANYDKFAPGLVEFMREAVKVYVKNRK
jgi:DNA-binding transcriptional MerR regulator